MKPLFFILFFPCSIAAFCQEKSPVNFGVKLGFGQSTLSPNYTDDNGNKHRFNMTGGIRAGGYLQISAGKKLLFQPELLFVVKGAYESTDYNNGYPFAGNGYPIRTSYIEIPLNLLVKLPINTGFFMLGGGPAPAFALNGRIYSGTGGFDLGINILLGYQWPIGFGVNLNFTKGFSSVYQQTQEAPDLKNSSLGISVGYTF